MIAKQISNQITPLFPATKPKNWQNQTASSIHSIAFFQTKLANNFFCLILPRLVYVYNERRFESC